MIIHSLGSFEHTFGDLGEHFKFVCCIKGKATIEINKEWSPVGHAKYLFECYKLGAKDPLETIEYINRRCS